MRSLAGVETEEVVRWEIVIKATDMCREGSRRDITILREDELTNRC